MAQNEFLFELIESEADVNIYFDREDRKYEKAGIIITSSVIGHKPIMIGDKFTLWFGHGLQRLTFKKFKDASLKAIEILETGNVPMFPRIEGRMKKQFLKIQASSRSKI